MSPMPRHGREAHLLARVVEALLDSEDRNYEAFTPITMDIPESSGIEPDYCFYINHWQAAVGKNRIDWQAEPPPDLVIEIDVTTYSAAEDYLPYRVPEVWLFRRGRFLIYQLENEEYVLREASQFFPEIDVKTIAFECLQVATERGTGVALRELRVRLSE